MKTALKKDNSKDIQKIINDFNNSTEINYDQFKKFITGIIKEDIENSEIYDDPIDYFINPKDNNGRIRKKIRVGYLEIFESFEKLEDIIIYIRNFPYSGTKITKSKYISYHIENYFSEIYILKNRMISYIQTIQKIYLRSGRSELVKSRLSLLSKDILFLFEKISEIRGKHVHKERFSDIGLAKLNSIELILYGENDDELKDHYNFEYRRIRKEWLRIINLFNIKYNFILNFYFKSIQEAIVDENHNLIYPS